MSEWELGERSDLEYEWVKLLLILVLTTSISFKIFLAWSGMSNYMYFSIAPFTEVSLSLLVAPEF